MTWLPQVATVLAVLTPGALAAWFTRGTAPATGATNWGVTPGPDPDYAPAGAPR